MSARVPRSPAGRDVVLAEWTKLRTVAGSFWLTLAIAAAVVALGLAAATAASCPAAGCHQDPARIALIGVTLAQAVVAVLAVQAVSGEYGSGMIAVTFAAMPRRIAVLAAKAALVSGLVTVAATGAVLVAAGAGVLLLPSRGFTADHGYRSLVSGALLRAGAGSVLYLVLIGLLSVGVAVAVRESAVAIGVVLGLLYVFPVLSAVVSDPDWHRRLARIAPMTAGLAIQNTIDLDDQPIGPWPGLGTLALWAAAALLVGGLLLRVRDA